MFFTKGVGKHREKLTSFELALRSAGIAACNLVRVSSIFPPGCRILSRAQGAKRLEPGQVTFVVMSEAATREPHRLIAATVGVAIATIAFASLTFAQRFDDVGVRAQGMAGAFVAVADDASATWWNPAGLATARNAVDFSAEISEGGRGGVALAFPSLGLSYYRN